MLDTSIIFFPAANINQQVGRQLCPKIGYAMVSLRSSIAMLDFPASHVWLPEGKAIDLAIFLVDMARNGGQETIFEQTDGTYWKIRKSENLYTWLCTGNSTTIPFLASNLAILGCGFVQKYGLQKWQWLGVIQFPNFQIPYPKIIWIGGELYPHEIFLSHISG